MSISLGTWRLDRCACVVPASGALHLLIQVFSQMSMPIASLASSPSVSMRHSTTRTFWVSSFTCAVELARLTVAMYLASMPNATTSASIQSRRNSLPPHTTASNPTPPRNNDGSAVHNASSYKICGMLYQPNSPMNY